MAKSVKLTDNTYWDSSSIVYNHSLLSSIMPYVLTRKSALTYASDFNEYTSPGYYVYNGYSGSDTGANRPTNTKLMGTLIVVKNETWNNIHQIFIPTYGTIYTRWYGDGSWKVWRAYNSALTKCDYIYVAKNNSSSEPIEWSNQGVWNYITMTDTVTNTNTSYFSSSSGVITIGAGVKKIRAYGQAIIQINDWTANDYIFSRISKNDVGVSKSITSELHWVTLYNEAIIEVSEGDKIKFEVYSDNNKVKRFYNYSGFGAGYGNFFIVEAIEVSV